MKWKKVVATIVVVVIASTLIGYYLESQQSSEPTLTYDFTNTASGDFLGWNISGQVYNNETNAVTIHGDGLMSHQFRALSPQVKVSLNWTFNAVMVIGRQFNGNYESLAPLVYSSENDLSYTNVTSFSVDNGSTFMVQFEVIMSVFSITYVSGVELWNSAELP